MGDPRKQRKKYSTPRHPWEAERIKEEKILLKDFGLKNKKEVWKMNSFLKKIKGQAKELIGKRGMAQADAEEKMFLEKLAKINLIAAGAKIEDVLDIQIRDVLERRLQTQLLRRGMAKTPTQARQFIVHGHVFVDGKKLDVPSYMVSRDEEGKITFCPNSPLMDEEHPERIDRKKLIEAEMKKAALKEVEDNKEEAPKKAAPKEAPKKEDKKKGRGK